MSSEVGDRYQRWFYHTWDEHLGWENARFIVVDSEATGLDARRDRIVSIGAVGLMHFEILLDDAFEVFLPIAYNTSAVTLHGITREMAEAQGVEEPVAMAQFLDYLRDGVIVGHHIGHDVRMFEAACQRQFGFGSMRNLVVDTMDLTLRLESAGALNDRPPDTDHPDYTLDGLCRRFEIKPHDRHTASGDAFLTAQVFLCLLKRAKRAGLLRLGQLTERWVDPKRKEEA